MTRPTLRPDAVDWLRGTALVVLFGALGWVLLTSYAGGDRFEPARRTIRAFFRAAQAGDSAKLRTLVSSDEPLVWARNAAAQVPSPIPDPDSALDIRRVQRWGDSEQVAVWMVGPCSRQPLFVTIVREGRHRRIQALRTDCAEAGTRDTAARR